MTNSRDKGARGERELAKKLREFGFDARRGQQFSGLNGDADVVGVDGLHIECKRCQRIQLTDWMSQSTRDARDGEIPVVMHRKNNERWMVTMWLDDFLPIWAEVMK